MSDAAAETPSPTAADADALSSRAAALANFLRRVAEWDFPADASIQISVIAGRSCTIEAGGPVIRQDSHADLFISADDVRFVEAGLIALHRNLRASAQIAATMASSVAARAPTTRRNPDHAQN